MIRTGKQQSSRATRGYESEPIITSLLDTDFYKFTMLQFIWKHYGDGQVLWKDEAEYIAPPEVRFGLIDRDVSKNILGRVNKQQLAEELAQVQSLRFKPEELNYLNSLGQFEPEFLQWLSCLELPPFLLEPGKQQYKFEVVADWARVMLWETLAMSVVSELFFRALVQEQNLQNDPYSEGERLLQESIDIFRQDPDFTVMDFASRRRSSKAWHHHVYERLQGALNTGGRKQLTGTSNVEIAMKAGERPLGTMAHELYMVGSGIHRHEDDQAGWLWSQEHINEQWWKYYGKGKALWLPDTFGTNSFLAGLSETIAYETAGFREDSSVPPIAFAKKIQKFYDYLGMSRERQREIRIVNSNSLKAHEAMELHQQTKHLFPLHSVGIGGGLGNRMGDHLPAPNIVVKPNLVNGQPVVKLSDTLGKVSGDAAEVARLLELQKATIARRPGLNLADVR